MDLLTRVRRTIHRHQLAGPDTRVVASVSGGSDSVALAYLLRELHEMGDLQLVGVAHFNHQLRETAERDERFCESLAGDLSLPVVTGSGDVRDLARRERRSIEDAARTARHAFLEHARLKLSADFVALGHTEDDQAETFLLRLIRGAGTKGLASMHPKADKFIRPLLDVRRADLIDYLGTVGRSYVTDESNADVTVTRNRIRLELLPLMAARFNPSVADVLADEAEIARAEYWYLKEQADAWQARFVRGSGLCRVFDVSTLAVAPLAISRMVVRAVMSELAGRRAVSFEDVERVLTLAREGGPPFDGPHQRVERAGSQVVLTGRPRGSRGRPLKRDPSVNLFAYSLSIPGEVDLTELGRTLTAGVASEADRQGFPARFASEVVALVQLDHKNGLLTVRNRRPGDRFQPSGFGHRRKLQDFFVDRKVAREERDRVPIVVDGGGRIVWVAGHGVDEAFRVKEPTQSVIILRLKGVGGSA